MSNTYRKHRVTETESLEKYIQRQLTYHYRRPYRTVWVKLTKEEIEAENTRRWNEYNQKIAEYAKRYHTTIEKVKFKRIEVCRGYYRNLFPEPMPAYHKKAVHVPVTEAEVIEEATADYKRWNRDGTYSETGRNKFFKYLAKKEVRSGWKKAKHKILRSEDYDYDEPYPGDYMGKKHYWTVW